MLGSLMILLAGLSGAAGVSLFAVAAHVAAAGSPDRYALTNAAIMLMVHGAAVLALGAIASSRGRTAWPWHMAGFVMIVGTLLFGGAVALPRVAGFGLFPMAAPIGGSLTILSWFVVAIVGIAHGLGGRDGS